MSMSCSPNYRAMNSIIEWYNQFTERYIQLQSDAFSEFSSLTMCVCVVMAASMSMSCTLNYRVMHSITKRGILWFQLYEFWSLTICVWKYVWVCGYVCICVYVCVVIGIAMEVALNISMSYALNYKVIYLERVYIEFRSISITQLQSVGTILFRSTYSIQECSTWEYENHSV